MLLSAWRITKVCELYHYIYAQFPIKASAKQLLGNHCQSIYREFQSKHQQLVASTVLALHKFESLQSQLTLHQYNRQYERHKWYPSCKAEAAPKLCE